MNPLPRLVQLGIVISLCGALSASVVAQNAPPTSVERNQEDVDDAPSTYAEMTLQEIEVDFRNKMRAYSKRYRAAPTAEDKRKVAAKIPSVEVYQERLIQLIEQEPCSEFGIKVIEWWYRRGRRHSGKIIVHTLLKHYAESASIEKYVGYLPRHLPQAEAEQQLGRLIATNPHSEVQASATFQLHEMLRNASANQNTPPSEATQTRIKKLNAALRSRYAQSKNLRGVTYVALLDAQEFAKKLAIGQPVPDIIGTDLDGTAFKLSDYDGKVRVISFWGYW